VKRDVSVCCARSFEHAAPPGAPLRRFPSAPGRAFGSAVGVLFGLAPDKPAQPTTVSELLAGGS